MDRKTRKAVKKLLIFLICFVATERFCRWQTAGFTVTKITSALPFQEEFSLGSPSPQITQLFDRPLSFLGSGAQFYAFETADGSAVVKFLKHSRRKPSFWIHALPKWGTLGQWRDHLLQERAKRIYNLLSSCKIAATLLKEESGILYAHLNKTECFNKEITLIDKIGIKHKIDIDRFEFVIQRKAIPANTYFKYYPDQVVHGIAELIKLATIHEKKSIAQLDPHIMRNSGFINHKAIDIDIGSFRFVSNPSKQKELDLLRRWLRKNHPDRLSCLHELS